MAFLDRFSHGKKLEHGENSEIHSILRNLNHVLNTKRYYGSIVEDYGVDDLSHCTSRDALTAALTKRIAECIENYEPRIELIEITPGDAEKSTKLSLVLDCRFAGKNTTFDLSFETSFSRFRVEHNQ